MGLDEKTDGRGHPTAPEEQVHLFEILDVRRQRQFVLIHDYFRRRSCAAKFLENRSGAISQTMAQGATQKNSKRSNQPKQLLARGIDRK
jgi:hypothetical protein